MARWSPATYLQYRDERSRPFFDLTERIAVASPVRVVDLGCGPGELTAALSQRWPRAVVEGLDSSPDMIAAAAQHATDRVRFRLEDLTAWQPDSPVDVIVSNATLQWVPGHRELLPRLVERLTDEGVLAFQVPGNFGEPSHVLLRQLAADDRFAAATSAVEYPTAEDAATYLSDLQQLSCRVDAWETTYLHVLTGDDPVFAWISGTGARPVLQALDPDARAVFEDEYKTLLREAYPAQRFGTVLPFRRVFAVAQRST